MFSLLLFILGLFVSGFFFLVLLGSDNREENILFSFPLGSGIVTLLIFVCEQAGIIDISKTSIFLAIAVIVCVELLLSRLARIPLLSPSKRMVTSRNFRQVSRSWRAQSPSDKIKLSLLILLGILLLTRCAMLPMTSWDSAFHLNTIAMIVQSGHIPSNISPDVMELTNAFPFFPVLVNACEDILVGYPSHWLHKLLTPLYAIGIFFLLYRIARKYLEMDVAAAFCSLILLCTCGMFVHSASGSSFDTQFNFFCIGALYFLLKSLKDGSKGSFWLAGVFMGLAYWTNYKGLVFLFCVLTNLVLWLIINSRTRRYKPFPISWGGVARVAGGAFALMLPHMVRNWLLCGNPVYPSLHTIFGGTGINEWSVHNLLSYHFPRSPLDIIPALDLFNSAFCVFIFFIIAVFYFIRKRRTIEQSFVAGIVILYWLVWFISMRVEDVDVTHYLMPAIIIAALLGGEHLSRLLRGEMPRRTLFIIIIGLALWWWFQFRLESAALGYVYLHRAYHWLPGLDVHSMDWGSWRAWFKTGDVFVFDFYELLLIPAFLLPFIANKRSISGVPNVLLCISLCLILSMPFNTIVSPFINHVDRAMQDTSYSLVEDIHPRWIQPEGPWMIDNLPENAVLYSFNNRLYIIPRRIFSALSTKLKRIYEDIDIEEAIAVLRQHGITHIYLSSIYDNYPLWGKSVIFEKLDDQRYFTLLYNGENRWEARKVWIYEIKDNIPSKGS